MKYHIRYSNYIIGILLLGFVALFSLPAAAKITVPAHENFIVDTTGTLQAEEVRNLEQLSLAIEQNQGVQLAVLIVPTTESETIEQFAVRVFETWKLGQKDIDNGLLILVALQDRKMRIEVGYGLEGVITDAFSHRVIENVMKPFFKQGQYYFGIEKSINALKSKLNNPEMADAQIELVNAGGKLKIIDELLLSLPMYGFSIFPFLFMYSLLIQITRLLVKIVSLTQSASSREKIKNWLALFDQKEIKNTKNKSKLPYLHPLKKVYIFGLFILIHQSIHYLFFRNVSTDEMFFSSVLINILVSLVMASLTIFFILKKRNANNQRDTRRWRSSSSFGSTDSSSSSSSFSSSDSRSSGGGRSGGGGASGSW